MLDAGLMSGVEFVGVTQLHLSAGAGAAFAARGIPYLLFVRDELQSMHPSLYSESLSQAVAVCCAGTGLGEQVRKDFTVNKMVDIPLPVDFGGRFGTADEISEIRTLGIKARTENGDIDTPRIAIVGVTPEKGFRLYQQLIPRLSEVWPEAHVDVYGGGAYAESIGAFDNSTWHGHTPSEEVFSSCDVHLLTVKSTGSWGRVINEAGFFGVPSVSVDIGSQPEAVGPGGVIVGRVEGVSAWVTALQQVYENRDSLGQAARTHCGVVDHRRSIAIFRGLLDELSE
jgi:glycosyltransferase involved in cell wall biosynthesis